MGLRSWGNASARVAVLVGLPWVAACSPFSTYEGDADASEQTPSQTKPDGQLASKDASVAARPDAAMTGVCSHLAPPPPPQAVSSSDTELSFTVAVQTIELGAYDDEATGRPAYEAIGYDLDRTCTDRPSAGSCQKPDWADPVPDGEGGRDNSAGSFFHSFFVEQRLRVVDGINANASQGYVAGVLRVRGYNGGPDDDDVYVAFYSGTRAESDDQPPPPKWDGHDKWRVFTQFVDDGGVSETTPDGTIAPARFYDPHGYVTDGRLVASLPELQIPNGMLERVFVTARIARDDQADAFTLVDGTVTGRLSVNEFLWSLADTVLSDPGAPVLCMGEEEYRRMKRRVCALADINLDGNDLGTARCDAVSWAWSFQAKPALIDGTQTDDLVHFEPSRICPDETNPKLHDSCDR